jgi:hypothetical protein
MVIAPEIVVEVAKGFSQDEESDDDERLEMNFKNKIFDRGSLYPTKGATRTTGTEKDVETKTEHEEND